MSKSLLTHQNVTFIYYTFKYWGQLSCYTLEQLHYAYRTYAFFPSIKLRKLELSTQPKHTLLWTLWKLSALPMTTALSATSTVWAGQFEWSRSELSKTGLPQTPGHWSETASRAYNVSLPFQGEPSVYIIVQWYFLSRNWHDVYIVIDRYYAWATRIIRDSMYPEGTSRLATKELWRLGISCDCSDSLFN